MTNGICHRVIAISRVFLDDQWKFLPWWLLSKSEYNVQFLVICWLQNEKFPSKMISHSFASLTIEQITIRIGVAVVAVNKSSEKCHQDEIEVTEIHCHTMEKL